jgi:hypothetical protein
MFLIRTLTAAALALCVTLIPASKADAQFGPQLKVTPKILKQKVNDNTYKVKLRVTAEVPGIAKNTFETEWMTIQINKPKPFELKFNAVFSMYGSIKYTGNKITASVTVKAGVNGANLKKTLSTSVSVS